MTNRFKDTHSERLFKSSVAEVPMTHPGEYLAEILEDLGLSATEFAQATGIDNGRLSDIVETRAPITVEMAVRIGKALDMTPEFWLSLQSDYDLETASGVATEVEPVSEAVLT